MTSDCIVEDSQHQRQVLRSRFQITEQKPLYVFDDDPPESKIERFPNGASECSVYLASHECERSIEADVSIELWAFSDDEPEPDDWWIGWEFTTPLSSGWPWTPRFCPFCGIKLSPTSQ